MTNYSVNIRLWNIDKTAKIISVKYYVSTNKYNLSIYEMGENLC